MALTETIVRGNVVVFSISFSDVEGLEMSPVSVDLSVNFVNGSGQRVSDAVTMTEDTDGEWSASWDSSEADAGRVYWSIRAYDPPAADQGFFLLAANRANPDEGVTG